MSKVHREHPLKAFLDGQGAARVADPGVRISIEPFLTHINVRGQPSEPEFVAAVDRAIGQKLPEPNRVSRVEHAIYWLGPEEFLVVARQSAAQTMMASFGRELKLLHAAATDLSGGQVMLTVSGSATYELMSKASTLDLDKAAFGIDHCALSTFAKSTALYALRDGAPTLELVVRRSFAHYIAQWFAYAGQEFGVIFDERTG